MPRKNWAARGASTIKFLPKTDEAWSVDMVKHNRYYQKLEVGEGKKGPKIRLFFIFCIMMNIPESDAAQAERICAPQGNDTSQQQKIITQLPKILTMLPKSLCPIIVEYYHSERAVELEGFNGALSDDGRFYASARRRYCGLGIPNGNIKIWRLIKDEPDESEKRMERCVLRVPRTRQGKSTIKSRTKEKLFIKENTRHALILDMDTRYEASNLQFSSNSKLLLWCQLVKIVNKPDPQIATVVWDVEKNEKIVNMEDYYGSSFLPDNESVLSISTNHDSTYLYIWNMKGITLRRLSNPAPIYKAVISPCGYHIEAWGIKQIYTWNIDQNNKDAFPQSCLSEHQQTSRLTQDKQVETIDKTKDGKKNDKGLKINTKVLLPLKLKKIIRAQYPPQSCEEWQFLR